MAKLNKERILGICGWTGGIFLAFCGFPEVIQTMKQGYCSLSWGFLLMWYLGEILIFLPVVMSLKSKYLMFNYGANIFFITILIGYKIFGG